MDVRMLLQRRLCGSLSIIVLKDRFSVHNFDFTSLLDLRIIQPTLEASLPGNAKPGWMGLHKPDCLNFLVSLRFEELGNRHDQFLKLADVVSHADTGWRIVSGRGRSNTRRSYLGRVKSLHRFSKENPVERQ